MDLIRDLRRQLDPILAHRGFVLSDIYPVDTTDDDPYGLLEYRAVLAGVPVIVLSISLVPTQQSIAAELWRPDDLIANPSESTVELVAMHRRVWRYTPSTDSAVLTQEIVGEVVGWLDPAGTPKVTVNGPPPIERLLQMIEQLRAALSGLARRQIPGDPLPCYCARYQRDVHDESCRRARTALAETDL
jgi:hypothetical protein